MDSIKKKSKKIRPFSVLNIFKFSFDILVPRPASNESFFCTSNPFSQSFNLVSFCILFNLIMGYISFDLLPHKTNHPKLICFILFSCDELFRCSPSGYDRFLPPSDLNTWPDQPSIVLKYKE